MYKMNNRIKTFSKLNCEEKKDQVPKYIENALTLCTQRYQSLYSENGRIVLSYEFFSYVHNAPINVMGKL